MLTLVSLVLLLAAAVGFVLLFVQTGALFVHRRGGASTSTGSTPRLSILKPLCGTDDDLPANLSFFATLPYPDYELLLGVETTSDPAYPLALSMARHWPERVRVLVQRGAPGLNPKVNQLATLAAAATGEILVISDSNTRAEPHVLEEIATLFADPEVGLVAHPVTGIGEQRAGAALDNLHLSSVGLGCVAAKKVAGQDVVVGKLMSLRRDELEALGGFAAVADVLAEDFVLGRWITRRLGKRVALAHSVVHSVARERRVSDFFARYCRWSVMQRFAVGNAVYLSQLLLNPVFLALFAAMVAPSVRTATALAAATALRILIDAATGALLRDEGFSLEALALSPLKDLLIGLAWLHGLTHDTVVWRGHLLRVTPGTALVPVHASPEASPALESPAEGR